MEEEHVGRKSRVHTSLNLAPALHRALSALAELHQRSLNGEIVWALEQYVAQQAAAPTPEQEAYGGHK